jgi:peptidoglycan/LPS O-acetylase OafA/YrhL
MRDRSLDGLRALAALSVVVFHTWLYTWHDPSFPTRAGTWNRSLFEFRIGLVLFFVLSGFLLYGPIKDLRRYAERRARRILPAYYVALVGALVLLWGGNGSPGIRLPSDGGLALFAVLGQNYSNDTILTLNPVTWTLAVELAFYALLPLFVRIPRVWLWLIPLGLAWNAMVHFTHADQVAAKALPAFLPYFALGMAATRWKRLPRWAPLVGIALVIGNAVWHSTAAPRAVNPTLAILADLPAAAGFALIVASAANGRLRWLGTTWLERIGLASYGIYLWHVPLILWMRRVDVLPQNFWPALLLVVPAAIAAGTLSWVLVERPLSSAARRERPPRTGSPARASTYPPAAGSAAS